ncbi:hypothetical protein B0H14DRAFT_2564164 [Mycena olivaceomarginata]|nr:hypothetical protein B0H14DRAFT_2564164 [Mycena olivaceomarginata]
MKGLCELSETQYKQDIITGDIVQHILQGKFSSLLADNLNPVKTMYDSERTVHQTQSGDLPFPPLGHLHEHGMPFELKNVLFSYPGTTARALDNITLSIKAGQLVVVVGANGSGKSTIAPNLIGLTGFFRHTSALRGGDKVDYVIGLQDKEQMSDSTERIWRVDQKLGELTVLELQTQLVDKMNEMRRMVKHIEEALTADTKGGSPVVCQNIAVEQRRMRESKVSVMSLFNIASSQNSGTSKSSLVRNGLHGAGST